MTTAPPSLEGLDVELFAGSVLDEADVSRFVDGADTVFHLAAKIDLRPKKDPLMVPLNVEGTKRVVEACLSRGIRLVHTSSHHALEREPLSQPLTELNPLALNEPCLYHRSKAVAEALVLETCSRGLDAVVVNPGSMVGPFDFEPSMIARALIDLYFGKVPILLDVLSDYVDVRDVADGMIAAAERGRTGERYLLTGHVVPILEMVRMFGEVADRPMPTRTLPLWVGWAMLPFALVHSRRTGKEPLFTADVLRASVSNEVVSHDKAHDELGYTLRGLPEAFRDCLAWYGEQGWLDAARGA